MRALTTGAIVLALSAVAAGCAPPAPPTNSGGPGQGNRQVPRSEAKAKENDGRVREIRTKCAETTEEGAAVLAKVQAWTPVVNGRPGDKPLRDVAAEYKEKGIYEICWGATRKQTGRWKVVYSFIDIQGAFKEAEWEHDAQTGETKPFDDDAQTFWTGKL